MKQKTKPKLPIYPEHFDRWAKRIGEQSKSYNIRPIIAYEAQCLLMAYYGSRRAMVWHMLCDCIRSETRRWWHHQQMRVCDLMGWTKWHHYPETDTMLAHSQRHGRQCSGSPNCSDMDCIDRAVPKWFKKLTFWND